SRRQRNDGRTNRLLDRAPRPTDHRAADPRNAALEDSLHPAIPRFRRRTAIGRRAHSHGRGVKGADPGMWRKEPQWLTFLKVTWFAWASSPTTQVSGNLIPSFAMPNYRWSATRAP